MKIIALCFLILLLLSGCAVSHPPTAPEQALVNRALQKEACGLPHGLPAVQDCTLYVVLDNRAIVLVAEVENGIPYLGYRSEFGMERGQRYGPWLDQITGRNRRVVAYLGPHDEGYDMAMWNYIGQPVSDGSS